MASSVKRVVTADVYAWMTPIEGVPGRYHHNTAARGEEIEVSAEEAKRGEGLGFLQDAAAARKAAEEAEAARAEAMEVSLAAAAADRESAEAGARADAAGDPGDLPAHRPPRAAAKDAWVEFAVAQGADRADAEASNKDDLVATYGA